MRLSGVFFLSLSAACSWAFPGRTSESEVTITSCVTPAGEAGTCTLFRDCSLYSSSTTDVTNDEEVSGELEASICKLHHGTDYVCCPAEKLNSPSEPFAEPVGSHIKEEHPPRSPRQAQPEKRLTHTLPNETECGRPSGSTRLPGFPVLPGYWPWLASLGHRTSSGQFVHTCGGSLITHRHVLTAAHCFQGDAKPDLVRLGEHNLDHDNDGEQPEEFRIATKQLHNFSVSTFENDIAIITLDKEVTFNEFIQPVCLPFNYRNNEFLNEYFRVAGWGKTAFGDHQGSKSVEEGYVKLVDRRQCSSALPGKIIINSRQLCAGTGTSTACVGDSGGPLNYQSLQNGRYYLAGILSLELTCQYSDFPGVYTRVSSYLDWIQQNL